eukprot:COSAG02_NODE_744_length_17752_cov_56.794992_13_plen_231_part_00
MCLLFRLPFPLSSRPLSPSLCLPALSASLCLSLSLSMCVCVCVCVCVCSLRPGEGHSLCELAGQRPPPRARARSASVGRACARACARAVRGKRELIASPISRSGCPELSAEYNNLQVLLVVYLGRILQTYRGNRKNPGPARGPQEFSQLHLDSRLGILDLVLVLGTQSTSMGTLVKSFQKNGCMCRNSYTVLILYVMRKMSHEPACVMKIEVSQIIQFCCDARVHYTYTL